MFAPTFESLNMGQVVIIISPPLPYLVCSFGNGWAAPLNHTHKVRSGAYGDNWSFGPSHQKGLDEGGYYYSGVGGKKLVVPCCSWNSVLLY